MRNIGGSVGIALIDTLLDRNQHKNLLDLSSHVSVLNAGTQEALFKMGVTDLSQIPHRTLGIIGLRMDQQVYLMSFNQMMWYVLGIFSFALVPLYFLQRPKNMDLKSAMDAH